MTNNKNANGAGVVVLIAVALVVANWISMLVFGAAAGYWGWTGPGFWQTFFSVWSIAILGTAFNGTRLKG